jgi:hypothetical protein
MKGGMKMYLSNSTNLNGKARISMRIYRNGKWGGLGLWWNVRQCIRESLIQISNLFKKTKGYATVLTQVGEEWIVDKLDETVQTTGDYVGWCTGVGTAAKGDTTLSTEASESRVTATRSQALADKIRWVATLVCAGAGKTITNAGNFTAPTSGTLIVHGDFTGIPLAVGDKIEFTIDLEIT